MLRRCVCLAGGGVPEVSSPGSHGGSEWQDGGVCAEARQGCLCAAHWPECPPGLLQTLVYIRVHCTSPALTYGVQVIPYVLAIFLASFALALLLKEISPNS